VLPTVARRHPLACAGALLAGAFLLTWSAATTSYILFHDDALRLLNNRAHSQAEAYQRQIATLEASLEEQRSRLAVEQRRTATTIEQLRQRQIAIEARHGLLSDLMNAAPEAPRPPKTGDRSSMLNTPAGPRAISDTVILGATDLREARLETGATAVASAQAAPEPSDIAALNGTLDRLEREQAGALDVIEETLERRDRRIRTVLADLGVAAPVRSSGVPIQAAAGGPFVPVGPTGDGFDQQSGRARTMLADLTRLKQKLDTVPLRRPIAGSIETTSGFGVRVDPFLGKAAFHTGIDFRGDTGDPARATAAGTVTIAGRDGGYGLMVEVDHGNGLSTRYAHLSAIGVSVGDRVAAGGVVGRVGSTGRSTGPHLHYETRIKGEPVDPQRFLRAGVRLGDVS
jgi:murein DD-endopeptidase MepM/ murein hydrolase activator NlpD